MTLTAAEEIRPIAQKNETYITMDNTNDFGVRALKMNIARVLASQYIDPDISSNLFKALKCKCVTFIDCNTMESMSRSYKVDETKLTDNDVSNVCLIMIRFLMLDGPMNRDSNLKILAEEATKYVEKRRGPNQILLEIIYPLLVIKNPEPKAAGTTSLSPATILGVFLVVVFVFSLAI